LIIVEQLISSLESLNITGQINRPVSGICFDSQEVKPGEVFAAIQGLESDGYAYQKQAIKAAAIVSDSEQVQNSIPFIQVKMPAPLWLVWLRNFTDTRIRAST